MASARVLTRARQFHAASQVGDEIVRTHSYQIAAGNGRYHGSGVAMREDVQIDDGLLTLYSLEPGRLLKLVQSELAGCGT